MPCSECSDGLLCEATQALEPRYLSFISCPTKGRTSCLSSAVPQKVELLGMELESLKPQKGIESCFCKEYSPTGSPDGSAYLVANP